MIITDMQKVFRGFWVIFYFIFLGIISVAPFYEEDFYALFYVVIILFSALEPQITKIFYVLPLGSKLLRQYLHLRAIVLSSFFIIIAATISLLSLRWPVPYIEKGWLVIISFVMICILMSLSIQGDATKKNMEQNNNQSSKKYTILLVFVIIMISASFISSMFLINYKIQLLINILFVIISEALLIIGLRRLNLENYVEPVSYGIFSKAWRNQQKEQFAEAKRGTR
ncbi:MAG: hypothetical protein GX129_03110 [Clostridiales bacterium]|jgi:hypothetical protein|nr:hypothetical protein [Clostridiales bacterium]